MSRTDKDRPYWVRLNDDATTTYHDHDNLGEPVYHYRIVRDETGHAKTVNVPWTMSATDIVKGSMLGTIHGRLMWIAKRPSEKLFQQARELHGSGRGDEQIICGYRTEVVYERYYAYTIADHCTEGERITKNTVRFGQMPCVPVFSNNYRFEMLRGKAGIKHHYSRVRYSRERVVTRDALGKTIRAYNAGYEVDDWDDRVSLTDQHHHSMAWDLY